MIENTIIHPQIDSVVDKFLEQWDPRLASSGLLRLDFTWPSLGVIDLIAYPLRFNDLSSELEHALLREITAYIAVCISKTWSRLNISHKVGFHDEDGSITIFVSGSLSRILSDSSYDPEDEVTPIPIFIERSLFDFFKNMPPTIPVFRGFDKPYLGDSNVISYLSLGLISCLSPFISGAWSDLDETLEAQHLKSVEKELARQTSQWFSEAFPDLPLSHVSELYLRKSIMPPYLFSDSSPMVEPVNLLLSYLRDLGVPRDMSSSLFRALSMCPDDQLSLLGISCSGFYQKHNLVPPEVYAASRVKRDSVPLVREAVLESYKAYKLAEDAFDSSYYIPNELKKAYETLYLLEHELGLLPWLSLPSSRLLIDDSYKKDLLQFIGASLDFDFVTASRVISDLCERNPSDINFRVQHIKLRVIAGDLDDAHELSKRLLSEPGSEAHPQFLNLWGSILLALDEPEIALRYFRGALKIEKKDGVLIDSVLRSEILNNTAFALIRQEEYSESLSLLKEAEIISLCPLTIYLNRCLIGDRTGDKKLQAEAFSKALMLAPSDRRVFALLV
ncbi:MAG TPA: tetratricopeptide repeat protein [Oligoflexia bacterium]|nr:tetratricopeptide repeat protein [Oligoflexia bacterium]HMP48192.1 tetratricopeptide repeat protein [Oligoflexia bacterium]